MSYIGNPIVSTDFPVDYFSGNGSTTAFTLSIAPASVNSLDVQVSGVSQSPQTYTVSGTTLTFSAAPPTGSSNIVVRHLGIAGIPNTPSAGSVVTTSIVDANVTQAKLASGVAGNGPAFSAYLNSTQTVTSGTATKVQFNAEEFDTANCYDPTTNYRFTPNVAGYYQVTVTIEPEITQSYQYAFIYKNGATAKKNSNGSSAGTGTTCTALIYMNGTTDYLEGYTYLWATSALNTGSAGTFFQASLVSAA